MTDIVFYSYKMNPQEEINTHEIKRFEHSIKSLREFNNEIPVYLFCDNPSFIPPYFSTEYSVRVLPLAEGFDHDANAKTHGHLFLHRWCNLKHFYEEDCNILYVDSDVIFYDDVQYVFDTYNTADVYGREEFGFRHDPNTGGSGNIRKQLDLVDKGITDLGGKVPMYKFCMGVLLLRNNIHRGIADSLDDMIDIMNQLANNEIPTPIPNRRIVDEYVMWAILSRLGASSKLFAVQDVTQGWIEKKHQEHFNPVICHYTTKNEQEFANSNSKYSNLIRNENVAYDPWSLSYDTKSTSHLSPEMVEAMAEDSAIIVEDTGEEWVYEG